MKILCVEDDISFGQLLKATLVKYSYQVDLVKDGESGWQLAQKSAYNLIILDLILPQIDGIGLCRLLREHQSEDFHNRYTPIILMTGLDAVNNKVTGLDAGADDYIVKPFDLQELLARIRALLRRNGQQIAQCLTWGKLSLNPASCEVRYGDQQIHLSKKEYEILRMFLQHPQQIFSHDLLLDSLWEVDEMPTQGALRAHIKGLRHKLRQAGVNNLLETVYKLGYRLKPPSTANQSSGNINKQQLVRTTFTKKITPVSISATDHILPELQEIWQQYFHSYQERVLIIQQAVTALEQGKISPEQQYAAEREAHTLTGSLGSFGLEQAAHIAEQIQEMLRLNQVLATTQMAQLKFLVQQLQQHINIDGSTVSPETNTVLSRLLIIAHDIVLAQKIATEAIIWGFTAQIVINSKQAQQILADGDVDLILLDLDLENNVQLGLDFLDKLRNQYAEIPVVVITQVDSFATRLEVARLGIACFLQKPITSGEVWASLTQLMQQRHPSLYRLLVVDDDRGILQIVHQLLSPYGYHITLLDQPLQFWETLENVNPDLLILDVELFTIAKTDSNHQSPLNGFDLCQVIRSDLRWNRLPILFLSAHIDVETIRHGFAVGANDFLSKPIVPSELQTRVRTRLEQQQNWRLIEIDALTGVSLRRKLLQDLTRLVQQARQQKQILSVAMLDLDFFKSINDKYGHQAGDRVLCYLGQLLNQSFRPEDVVGRWGGEEFVIGMYGVAGEVSQQRLTEVLQKLQQHSFTTDEGGSFRVTFSAGIAQFPHDGQDVPTLIHRADIILYQAKQQGRNLVLLAANDYTQ